MPTRILWAFFRRDFTIHTSYRLGFAIDLLGVFFSAATFYFVAKMVGPSAMPLLKNYGGDYFAFVLIGIAFSTYQNVGLNSFAQSLRQEQFINTLEPLLLTPVTLPQFLLGSSLWDFLYATAQVGFYLALGMVVFGLRLAEANVGPAGAVLVLTLIAFMGLGVLAAAFIMRFKRGNPVTWLVVTASELLGGVYFPVEILPGWLKSLSRFVPMTHALTGLRKCLLMGAGWGEVLPQLTALALFALAAWPLGLWGFSAALKRARADGSLGHY
ncbi:MAG TPA: ABC transporter permease [Elusimicrobiota bacterium]|nr:ABC transporter permease [Elusimicrobiota bacterium]